MKILTRNVLILVELMVTAKALVFKRYFAVNGSMVEGDWTKVLGHGEECTCMLVCKQTTNCTAVNHNRDTGTCELVDGSSNKQFSLTTAIGWNSYFISLTDIDPLSNAITWQSATYSDDEADGAALRAVDGNTYDMWAGGSCAHPMPGTNGEVWWMADFQRTYTVSAVIIWNRRQHFERLVDILMTVGSSPHSMTTCGYYKGPPRSVLDTPLRTDCSRTIPGRFLKIEQTIPKSDAISVCEVEVVQ